MKLLLLSGDDLRAALPMRDAIEATKEAYAALSAGAAEAPPRVHVSVDAREAVTLLMGAHVPSMGLAAKIVSVFPRNAGAGRPPITGLVVVLDPETGEPDALVDGAALTAWRTGAASGASIDILAREDARVGALIGCGAQGETQLIAMDAARTLEEIRVFARTPSTVEAFCARWQGSVAARIVPAGSAREAVREADLVCTATPATEPVLHGDDLPLGVHVSAVGSFTPAMREFDARLVERARVFIDDEEAALAEAGELVAAEALGATSRERWTPLGRVVLGESDGRTRADEITLFKSVGHAVQDVAAATRALDRARAAGLGTPVEF